jgi:ATP-dependent DNA helicase RecG
VQKKLLTPFKNTLGYEFTKAQIKAINEIFNDLSLTKPMNRLLQGDVGSGKTVVALSAALLANENKYQAVFLAPTEILAGQHAITLERFFKSLPIKWALLTGSTPKPERKKILEKIAKGDIHVLIGTHAILNEDVTFKNLGLIIIDEQHRFGVRQRAKLVSKGENLIEKTHPHVLIMTATPIPRTLALTLYGDLDVSVIDQSPEGRQTIKTSMCSEKEAFQLIKETVTRGEQAYIVFPFVEESEKLSKKNGALIKAATQEYSKIKSLFDFTQVGLLHGQMSSLEKQAVMDQFRSGECSILVATPVIEVGIDVPNATLMVIVNPERFGLSQLHQLRGRVGRGTLASECKLVIPDDMTEVAERLKLFCAISNGFLLSEEDLKIRGPGEFLGEAQHGVPIFRVGDLIHDGFLISQTKEAAHQVILGKYSLTYPESATLNSVLNKKFGSKIHLSRIG